MIDGLVGIEQQFAGVANPDINEKLGKTAEGVFVKKMAKCRIAHIDLFGHVADFERGIGKVFQDIRHWGRHHCILRTREGWWDSARVGAGAAPIKTPQGWLEIYHGADEQNRYSLGAVLLDLKNPAKVLARSHHPIFEPVAAYERTGFLGNVVFTNGHLVKGDEITLYYGASDEVICGATLSIEDILSDILTTV